MADATDQLPDLLRAGDPAGRAALATALRRALDALADAGPWHEASAEPLWHRLTGRRLTQEPRWVLETAADALRGWLLQRAPATGAAGAVGSGCSAWSLLAHGAGRAQLDAVDRALDAMRKDDPWAARAGGLYAWTGLSDDAIADALELAVGTVRRALRRLRYRALTQLLP